MVLVWLALAVSLAAVATTATMTTLRGIAVYRDARRLGGQVDDELTSIERRTGEIEMHLAAAARSGDALSVSVGRLADSRARLNVLLAAIADVRAALARVTVFLPRK